MAFPDPFTPQDAQDLVRELADLSHPVNFTDHFFDRADLRDVDPRDVLRALCKGIVTAGPTWDADYRDWNVTLEGSSAGLSLRVELAISEDKKYFAADVKTVIVIRESTE